MKTLLLLLWLAPVSIVTASGPAMGIEDRNAWNTEGMRNAHPDVRWRLEAMEALEQGRATQARTYLERAARFGDKPAQALLAEMHWEGRGGETDRAAGYAWMDLAAERGNPLFASWRERYWAELDQAERARALEVGKDIYAEYGDAIAQPRLERTMARHRRQGTGSRTGSTIGVRVYEAPAMNNKGVGMVDASGKKIPVGRYVPRYYENKFWNPDEYWTWKEEVLAQAADQIKGGQVTVGELETGSPRPSE